MSYSLAIDIGGTKFSVAFFAGGCPPGGGDPKMTHHASSPTNRNGGPEWMLAEIAGILRDWPACDRCGIGFGGPVDFERQRVALSTHVGGWQDFPLVERIAEMIRVPVAHN